MSNLLKITQLISGKVRIQNPGNLAPEFTLLTTKLYIRVDVKLKFRRLVFK